MARLIIIVGTAASGKSHLARELNQSRFGSNALVFEDATLTNTDSRRAGHRCLGELVAQLLGNSRDCIMDECHLVHRQFRNSFRDFCSRFLPGVETEWIYFEKNELACINNAYADAVERGRNDYSRFHALHHQLPAYNPENETERTKLISVHKQSCPQFHEGQLVEARHWLEERIRQSRPGH